MTSDALWATLRCVHCDGGLVAATDGAACRTCGQPVQFVGRIPCLLPNPNGFIQQWRHRAAAFVDRIGRSRAELVADLLRPDLSEASRTRLQRLHEGLGIHLERILGLLAAEGIDAMPGPVLESDVPGEGHILAHYHQIHRDWGWDDSGSRENIEALATLADLLDGGPDLGTTLVLGAGACRLGVELHVAYRASLTVALDLNPLPLFVARRVIAGEQVALLEFPLAPTDLAHVWVDRALRRNQPPPSEFYPVFADGLNPPVVPGGVDSVVTPWFIDQVPPDIAGMIPTVRHVLRPGGRWINHGPLIYHPRRTALAHRYPLDEVIDLVRAAGFRIEALRTDRLAYMQSPACTRGRAELVTSFVAVAE